MLMPPIGKLCMPSSSELLIPPLPIALPTKEEEPKGKKAPVTVVAVAVVPVSSSIVETDGKE